MLARFAVLLLVGSALALDLQSSSLSFDVEAAQAKPVSKVINLLKDMAAEIEAEGKADEEIYDQMACWCETNDKEKTKAIADSNQRISDLNIAIEEYTASSARLGEEIKTLEVEVEKNQKSLAEATEIRFKDMGEFQGEEKDLLSAINALKSAILVIGKNHASLLQVSSSQSAHMAMVLQSVLHKHATLLEGIITPSENKKMSAFIQVQQQQPASAGSYAPASGEILGILKQMKETFESNLSQGQKDEATGSDDYGNLKATKETEITAGQDQIEAKTQELATTDEKNAQSKEDLEETEELLAADEKFLANLKEQCAAMDAQFEERSKTRAEEAQAVSKATAILSSDDAHDLFAKNFGFIQTGESFSNSKRRALASKILTAVARKNNNAQLITLAVRIRLDAFTKVKQAIDDMIAELDKQQADEVKLKDFCRTAFNENLRATEDKERERKELEEVIADLEGQIAELTEALKTLKAEVKEMQFQFKRAGENREKENVEFQESVKVSRSAAHLLTQAMDVLKGFFEKEALLQKQQPPVAFKAYKKSGGGGGGVIGMIQGIIDETVAAENEVIRAEADAQTAYEAFVKDTNASIDANNKDIVTKSEVKAQSEAELTKNKETFNNVMEELEGLSNENADLHAQCDFVMKNFEIRQTARAQEIEALKQVKAILSGAKFSNFLQSSKDFAGVSAKSLQNDDEKVDPLNAFLDSADIA